MTGLQCHLGDLVRQVFFYESVEPLVHVMIEAFQRVTGGNVGLANQRLPLVHLRALGGKKFNGVRGADPTKAEYWLEGVEKVLERMA